MASVSQIAEWIDAPIDSIDPEARDRELSGIGSPEGASPDEVAFLIDPKAHQRFEQCRAGLIVISSSAEFENVTDGRPTLRVPDVAGAMQVALERMAPPIPRPAVGVDSTARIHSTASLGKEVAIGPSVAVGARVTLGHRCVLHPGVILADDVTLGDDCELFGNVVIRERCTIGHRVVLHAGTVIGSDGFGYRWDGTRHVKQLHVGTVVIEDDVEIGSCSCVDRAKVDETRIGTGTKIDNLVQVGHNVRVGRHCILCAGVAIGGSSVLGDGVILGGGTALRDHVNLGDGARVGGFSAVPHDVAAGETLVGAPAVPHADFLREQGALRRLPSLRQQVRLLHRRLAELERSIGPGEPE